MGETTGSDVLETGIDPRADDARWQKVFALVHEQRMAFDMALLNHLGHGNPGVMKRETLPLDEAKRRHAELAAEIAKQL
ncbi:MAG: hypothetical protein D6773_17905 [Alphaproteobacteria bacterium]|nr:MAG: hypothetical protein D6773_17905 [Alphaproteobacteria bacterium]